MCFVDDLRFFVCLSASFFSFYSYTETPEEVSVILDEPSLRLFPQSAFDSGLVRLASTTPWKAIQLTLGASPGMTIVLLALL
jgi:hypothetical protein